jgi:hypothetical protein
MITKPTPLPGRAGTQKNADTPRYFFGKIHDTITVGADWFFSAICVFIWPYGFLQQ